MNTKELTMITQTNFFKNTLGRWTPCETPKSKPDFISKTIDGRVSSVYFYSKKGVVRVSDHWGGVASCQWNLDGLNNPGFDECRKVESPLSGFISWKELTDNYQIRERSYDAFDAGDMELNELLRNQLKSKF